MFFVKQNNRKSYHSGLDRKGEISNTLVLSVMPSGIQTLCLFVFCPFLVCGFSLRDPMMNDVPQASSLHSKNKEAMWSAGSMSERGSEDVSILTDHISSLTELKWNFVFF